MPVISKYKIQQKINYYLNVKSIVLIEGALYSGKTHFIKNTYLNYNYVSLKNKTALKLFNQDPYRFFNLYSNKTIFDDIEEASDLIEKLSTYSLSIYQSGNYILISNVKTDSKSEFIAKVNYLCYGISDKKQLKLFKPILEVNCLNSSFPKEINFKNYIDKLKKEIIPKIVNIQDEEKFNYFLVLCAQNINKTLNLSYLAKKIQKTQPTIEAWLTVLEKIGLLVFLTPLKENYGKRIIKSFKIYFPNTGILSCLLKIKNIEQLLTSEFFEAIYSNLIITELIKKNELEITPKNYHFWKESNGHEIKFLFKNPTSLDIYDIISSHEIQKNDLKELEYFDHISEGKVLSKNIIYGGHKNVKKNDLNLISWQEI